MTAPKENGEGAFMAMKKALKQAQLPPSAVDYVNAHATSTIVGDAAENAAIRALLLGPGGKEKAQDVNISSTKGAIGHLLGGAGAIEAAFCVLAIQDVSGLPQTILSTNGVGNFGNVYTDYLECYAADYQLGSFGRWVRLQLCGE